MAIIIGTFSKYDVDNYKHQGSEKVYRMSSILSFKNYNACTTSLEYLRNFRLNLMIAEQDNDIVLIHLSNALLHYIMQTRIDMNIILGVDKENFYINHLLLDAWAQYYSNKCKTFEEFVTQNKDILKTTLYEYTGEEQYGQIYNDAISHIQNPEYERKCVYHVNYIGQCIDDIIRRSKIIMD